MKNLAEFILCKVFLVIHCYHFCTEISIIKRFLPLVEMKSNIIRQAELVQLLRHIGYKKCEP